MGIRRKAHTGGGPCAKPEYKLPAEEEQRTELIGFCEEMGSRMYRSRSTADETLSPVFRAV